ncbi:MAG: GAF domain-containing protein, partial [Desulfomonilaceae bacterium]|nr:GAF domain-containing protein [Desulfomonilaceae bacterium]
TLELDEILNVVLESSIDTLGGKAACLFLADEEKDVFVPVAQRGLSESYLHARPMRAKKVVDEILQGGHLSIYDAGTDPRLENHEEKKAEGIASILVVPVITAGKTIGVLSLYTGAKREFTADEIEFQAALAEQGAMAIERARLFERINRNMEFFYDLASTINSSLDIKKILHILTADIADTLGLKGVDIRLWNKETGTLDIVASYALSEEFLNKGPVSAEKAVTRQVLNGETVVIKDIATDERVQYRDQSVKEGIASMLIVPVRAGDEVIGTMGLCSGVRQGFPEETIKLANALANQGGLAIQNASLYLMLQEDKKSLEQDIWSHRSWF